MARLRMLAAFLVSALEVTSRRWRQGPARPSWSWRFEAVARLVQRDGIYVSTLSPAGQRAHRDGQVTPFMHGRQVNRRPETIAGVPATWFEPRDSAPSMPGPPGRTICYFHGGAYIFGSAVSHQELLGRLCLATRARVLAPEYRLAPEHPFPAAIDDAVAVVRSLTGDHGVAPEHLILAGDSAGGGLTMATLQRLRDAGAPMPAGAMLLSPWVDLNASGGSLESNMAYDFARVGDVHGWARSYMAGGDLDDPLASPINARFDGFPPLYIEIGDAEMLLDQVREFEKRAREGGADVEYHEWPDMIHDGWLFAGLFEECQQAYERLAAFVDRVDPR